LYEILISGHRGFRSKEVDNTAKAFERAIKFGLDYIEFDVRTTKDKIPVIFHDYKTNNLLNWKGKIHKIDLKTLKQLKYKDNQKILTLDEMFSQFSNKIKFILEIKSNNLEKKIIEMIKNYELENNIIIQSYNRKVLKKCYELYPNSEIKWCLCIGPVGIPIKNRISKMMDKYITKFVFDKLILPLPYVSYLNIDAPLVSESFILYCVKMGKNIILGAKKPENFLNKLIDWNVKIINCDDPELIVNEIRNKYSSIYSISNKIK